MSSYYYLDKNIKNTIPESTYKRTQKAQDSDDYASGDIIEAWDHVFRWDASCISDAKMQSWRARGDSLADAALPFIMSSAAGSTDLFARLEAAASRADAAREIKALWKQLNAGAEGRDGFDFDRAQILRGQAVFYRYAPQILASLLQFSLAAGFSSPSISRLLNLTSYLVPPMSSTPDGEAPRITKASNDRTYMRLMETTQFVVDCMGEDAMEVDNDGWKAAI
ncbi:putative rubber oxygenase Lcp [Septoria linicola]|nr:putative rubber oxygenase Lcp [Septoria linicola]